MTHDEQAGIGEVTEVDEVARRLSAAPDRYFVELTIVHAPHQGRNDVAAVRAEIVKRAIGIAGKGGDEVDAVLPAKGLAQLPAGELGQRVSLACRFNRSTEE